MARTVELTIEDGTNVEGANSFASEEQIVSYAKARGVLIPYDSDIDKDAVAVLGIKAIDYIRSKAYKGLPKIFAQYLPFPRAGMVLDLSRPFDLFPDDAIPGNLIEAQCRLALEVKNGVDLMPTMVAGEGMVIREKVGSVEMEYSDKVGNFSVPHMPAVDAILAPLLASTGGFALRTLRI